MWKELDSVELKLLNKSPGHWKHLEKLGFEIVRHFSVPEHGVLVLQ